MEYYVAYLIFAYGLNFIVIAYWVGTNHPVVKNTFSGPNREYGLGLVPYWMFSPLTCILTIFILLSCLFCKIFGTYD
jgi:hypothetical protein